MATEPAGHAPPLRFERAHRALQWTDAERRQLEAMLADFGERVYLRTILAEMDRHGIELTPQRISDTAQAWGWQARARARDIAARDAATITQTRNRLITNAVDKALGRESATLDVGALMDELRKIDVAYATWKAEQINETERYVFYQAAFEDFYRDNSDVASLFEFGGSLQCALCQEVAGGNPYTLQGMMAVDDPVHIGCLDVWEPV